MKVELMAGGSGIIGSLRVVLGADTAALDKGLKDSQAGLASFAKQVTAIVSGIGLEKALEGASMLWSMALSKRSNSETSSNKNEPIHRRIGGAAQSIEVRG